MMWFPDKPMGGSETMYGNIQHLIPENVNLMLNNFNFSVEKANIHWQHQYHDQPSVLPIRDKNIQNRLDATVFVSYHQKHLYEQYHDFPKEKSVVIKNAIWPFEKVEKPKGKINLIYTSTPFRGLNILLAAFALILHRRPDLRELVNLDVFSSMDLYGYPDEQYSPMYEFAKQHPNINYHGVIRQEDLRPYLLNSHIFAYPCIFEETSCISAIEAMAAGAIPVVSDIGALPETCGDFGIYYSPVSTDMYNNHRHNDHVAQYAYLLEYMICEYLNNPPHDMIDRMTSHYNYFYNWEYRIQEWKGLFDRFGG
jgi:UDP-glucose:(glucosyl)LPS alpha-1,2-glucosyltransferase